MGGEGSGRRASPETIINRALNPEPIAALIPANEQFIISNISAVQDAVKLNSRNPLTASKVVVTDASSNLISGTNSDSQISTAVTASHTQGTDTALGTMTADINMNSLYQIVGLQAPAASGEAIRQTAKITEAKMEAADDHVNDSTQAHSDYLLNSGVDEGVGLTLTGDNSSADTAYVPMVLYNTDATPPTASGFPIGTLYVQYTA